MDMGDESRSFGQVGYEAYGATAGWKTFDDRPMPTWEQLGASATGQETRRRWEHAAIAICDAMVAAVAADEPTDRAL